jgi:hypothetical protein
MQTAEWTNLHKSKENTNNPALNIGLQEIHLWIGRLELLEVSTKKLLKKSDNCMIIVRKTTIIEWMYDIFAHRHLSERDQKAEHNTHYLTTVDAMKGPWINKADC